MKLKDIPKGEPTAVTETVFREIMSDLGSEAFRKQYNRYTHPSDEEFEYYIYVGDINSDTMLQTVDAYMLVIGNIKTTLLNINDPYDTEGGEFIVIGNVECDYYQHQFGKSTFIDGNLKVNKVLNDAFDDSAIIIINDLDVEFYYASNAWATVGGKVTLQYGFGYAFPIGYTNPKTESINPIHSEKESAAFLGTTMKSFEDNDFIHILMDEKIESYSKD